MSARRVVLLLAGFLVLASACVGGLLAWKAIQVNSAMQDAVRDVDSLRAAVRGEGRQELEMALTDLQMSSGQAAEQTRSAIWSLATLLPAVGDDARGVRVVAKVLSDLSSGGLGPLLEVVTAIDDLMPHDRRIDVGSIRELAGPVAVAAEALRTSSAELAEEDSSGFMDRLRVRYREMTSVVDEASRAADSAQLAVELLPELLGSETPQDHLLVFQNNAELRATGGLIGAMAVVRAEDGLLELTRQDTAASFGPRAEPVLPLSPQEKEVFSPLLGTFIQDANFTPDWPRAAELIRARWQERHPQDDLHGVLAVDTVAVSYLLAATGPIEVGGYTLTSENAVSLLLNQIYIDMPDPAKQDPFFAQAARAVFDAVASGRLEQPQELLRALVRAGEEGRIYAHFTDSGVQESLAGRRVAGAVYGPGLDVGVLDVSLLDGTGSKMSYYLDYAVEAETESCSSSGATVRVRVSLISRPPGNPDSLPASITGGVNSSTTPGDQLVHVRLMSPPGGEISDFTIRGENYDPGERFLGDRQVATASLLLKPRTEASVEWTVAVRGDWSSLPVRVTPGIDPIDYSSLLERAC